MTRAERDIVQRLHDTIIFHCQGAVDRTCRGCSGTVGHMLGCPIAAVLARASEEWPGINTPYGMQVEVTP